MTKANWNTEMIGDQTGRLVVITGATSGIGKETVKVLAGKYATVIIGARNLEKAEGVIEEIKVQYPNANLSARELDLTSLVSVKAFADSILTDFDKLDVLINNAGIMVCPYAKTQDGFEIQMGTNHLGHFALTGRLMPLLKQTEKSRIVILSSYAHKFGDIDLSDLNWETREYNTNKAYGDSKIANLYFLYELVSRLANESTGEGYTPIVSAAHPGWTKTELQRHTKLVGFLNHFFAQGADQGALPTLRAGFDDEVRPGDYYGPSKFFEMHGAPVKVASNTLSHDKVIARKLWVQSEALTGVSF
ncbi:KR domain-containing protein [Photobacterium sanctipauli]|uniref:KR domain-containing protein n=1 Tax=Photobacterium sanctipauli TaxID=1342794 RepID=A0A2T3NPJ9_9GAMM|nr:oxidoreductase [Photobacterium sanctipauli]PSW18204.1 KR domain-containing protein [Photobacterium sanctipauli]